MAAAHLLRSFFRLRLALSCVSPLARFSSLASLHSIPAVSPFSPSSLCSSVRVAYRAVSSAMSDAVAQEYDRRAEQAEAMVAHLEARLAVLRQHAGNHPHLVLNHLFVKAPERVEAQLAAAVATIAASTAVAT